MTDSLTVRRWSRYGADRLFVTAETGARLGSVDLISGEVVAEHPALETGLRLAVQEFLRQDATEVTVPSPQIDLAQHLDPEPSDERDVPLGARLDRLEPDGWHVLHDVPLSRQGAVVEHLLIGPGGIYVVSAHHHPGELIQVERRSVIVGRKGKQYLRDARFQAERVAFVLSQATELTVSARGVLVLSNGELRGPKVTSMPDDALVLGRTDVPGVFRMVPRRLTDDEITELATVAREKSTWTAG